MFLTNNSPDLYALLNFLHYVQKRITVFLHGSQEYPQIRMKIIDVITQFQAFANISGNFWNIYQNIKFP